MHPSPSQAALRRALASENLPARGADEAREPLLVRLKRSVGRNPFARRLAVLSGGPLAGQALILATSPVLTRLFTPAEFGVYAAFTALNGILGNVLSLRYELAAPIARRDEDAAGFVALSVLTLVASCALTVPLVWLGGTWLAQATGMPPLASLLWLLPLTIVLLGAGEAVSDWSVYRGTFRLNAAARLTQSVAQSASQVAFGLWGAGPVGLVAGYALGYAARLAHLLPCLPGRDRLLLATVPVRDMLRLARRHWHYPAYSAPANLLEAGTQLVPVLLLAALYGPAVAGLFSLGQRLMGLPVRLLSQAARQVFLGAVAGRGGGLYRLFRRSSLAFLALGLVGVAPVLLTGPALFAFLFGEPWRAAGDMVQLLVPLYLARFVVTPVSQTLNVLGRQHLHLVSSSLDALLMLATFAAAWRLQLPPLTTVLLFSLGSALAYALYFALAWRAARGRAEGVGAPA